VQGNIWTEHISTWNHLEYMAFPRTCALAEVAWSQVSRHDWNSFRDRLGMHLLRLAARDVRYRQP
jgi:hexosaminidase